MGVVPQYGTGQAQFDLADFVKNGHKRSGLLAGFFTNSSPYASIRKLLSDQYLGAH